MKRLLLAIVLVGLPVAGFAAGPSIPLDKANIDISDTAALQRGAKYFVNYCQSCHSAQYMRYNRMGADLGLSDDLLRRNLMFATDRVGDTMQVAMPAAEAREWFGKAPPDLSVIARSNGVDWLYTFLRTFYLDEARPFGVNNLTFPDVGMPHVLWDLQGVQAPVYRTETGPDGQARQVIDRLELVVPGKMTPGEFDQATRDLVAFLDYVGEPAKLQRQQIGIWVLLFLGIFLVITYLLKKEYWRDVH
jgi:ubiquinol-cytochrome c reductase cytochrome c1 subunit